MWTATELVFICSGLILIILLTIGGNLVVLFAFFSDPHLLTPSNNFLLSMAIADLLVGLVGMPFYSYAQLKGYWPFGELFCKIWLTVDDVATMASVLSIVAITIERYWSINYSVHYRRYTTKTRIRIFSVLIWLIPLLNFAPGIWFLEPHDDVRAANATKKNSSECMGAYHSYTIYLIVAQTNFFAWPLLVIIVLNALIVVNLYQRSHRFQTFDNTYENRKSNLSKKFNDDILNEIQQHPIESADEMVSMIHENNHSVLLQNTQGYYDRQRRSIPPVIREVDEPLIEHDIIESSAPPQATPCSPVEIDIKRSSSPNICARFKNIFVTSSTSFESALNDQHSSKSTQTVNSVPLKSARRSIFNWRHGSPASSANAATLASVSGEQRHVRRLRRDKRAATSLLILVLVFMIFLLPYVVVVVAGNIFSLEIFTDTDGEVYSAAFWLLWLNSTVNPILYPFIQPKFRDAYRRIFSRIIRRRRRLLSLIIDIQRNK